jgi:hypothetical protein
MKIWIAGLIAFALLGVSIPCLSDSLWDEELEVYSVALSDFLKEVKPSRVLVLSPTAIIKHGRYLFPNAPPETDKLLSQLIEKSATPMTLPAFLGTGHEYKVVSENEQKFLSIGKPIATKRLRMKYPKSRFLILLSRVGFNDSGDSALVQIEVWGICKTGDGNGRSYLLNKTNGNWEIASSKVSAWNIHM